MKRTRRTIRLQRGSIELVVLGLLAALLVVLAVPLLTGFEKPQKNTAANNSPPQATSGREVAEED